MSDLAESPAMGFARPERTVPHDRARVSGTASSTSAAAHATRIVTFDARAKIVSLLVFSASIMGARATATTYIAAVLAVVLLLVIRQWNAAKTTGIMCAALAAGAALPPLFLKGTWVVVICMTCMWLLRFAVMFGFAAFLLLTTSPAQFTAAMVWARLPRCVIIPMTVVFRFIPALGQEYRSIMDAMQLRGIAPGFWNLLAHPIRSSEYMVVPLLASSTRLADDLSASGLLRGLGANPHPTSAEPLRFSWPDVLLLTLTAAIALVELLRPFGIS